MPQTYPAIRPKAEEQRDLNYGQCIPQTAHRSFEALQYLFSECSSLESLDLSSFDTRNVKNMFAMFRNCTNLKTLNISSFNTVEVQDMSDMFNGCRSLTSLDLSSFDTSSVTDMSHMFRAMHPALGSDKWYSLKLEHSRHIFYISHIKAAKLQVCQAFIFLKHSIHASLPKLGLSSFDTSNVTNMGFMFSGCSNLPELDLRSFDTSKVLDMSGMILVRLLQPSNILVILVTLLVSKFLKSKLGRLLQPENIESEFERDSKFRRYVVRYKRHVLHSASKGTGRLHSVV